MLNVLDDALHRLLKEELKHFGPQVTITFETPDVDFPPDTVTLPAIDLFLYDIREKVSLRAHDPRGRERERGVKRSAPMTVECSYLVTAWPAENTQSRAREEHMLLGAAMRAVARYRRIPDACIAGAEEADVVVLLSVPLQGDKLKMGEFWQAMGNRPRAMFDLRITFSFDPHAVLQVPMVQQRELRLDLGTAPGDPEAPPLEEVTWPIVDDGSEKSE